MASFFLLGLTILSLWAGGDPRTSSRARWLWLAPFAAWLPAALAAGVLEPVALGSIGALAALAWTRGRARRRDVRIAVNGLLLVTCGALMSHALPGFNNPRVLDGVRFSPDALPFSLHLNADKPLVGLFLLGWLHPRTIRGRDWRELLGRTLPVGAGTIAVLLLVSLAAGYVRPDLKWPAAAPLWLAVNLLFTCVAEEALFRGFIQARLQAAWGARRGGVILAVGVAALLFGLAHLGGGWTYVALASLAGAGYGWAYARTGRIEASILTHFALNTVHFLAFTYPALAGPAAG